MYVRSSLALALLFVSQSFAAVNPASFNTLNVQNQGESDDLLYSQAANPLDVEVNAAPQTIEAALSVWLRAGFDPDWQGYPTVDGQHPADARDHFVELQWIRDSLIRLDNWQDMNLRDLFALTKAANKFSNVFRITTDLNGYKSHVDPSDVLDPTKPRIKDEYLCQEFNPPAPPSKLVHERVTVFLNDMQTNPNDYVVSVGLDIEAHLGLENLVC